MDSAPIRATPILGLETTNIHAKLQLALREKINMSTSSVHKEQTHSGKKIHVAHVNSLKDKLASYEIDQFGGGSARHLTTIATPKGELRQCPKNVFGNFIVEESKSLTNECLKNARLMKWPLYVLLRQRRPTVNGLLH